MGKNIPLTGAGDGGADPYAGYLVYDTFTDTNGVSLDAHTPEKAPAAWVEAGGVWDILGNKAEILTPGDAQNAGYIDGGQADVTIECSYFVGNQDYSGLVFRASALNDNFEVLMAKNEDLVYLVTDTAGSRAVIGSAACTVNIDSTFALKAALAGTSIKISVDTVELVTATSSHNQTDTSHGFFQWAGAVGCLWDNLTVIL